MYIEIPLWQRERHSRYTRLGSDDKTREIRKEVNYSPNQSLVAGELQKFPNKSEDFHIGESLLINISAVTQGGFANLPEGH